MSPAYELGDTALLAPHVQNGDLVFVYLNADAFPALEDSEQPVIFAKLLRRNHEGLTLQHINPPTEFAIPISSVAKIHRLVKIGHLLTEHIP